jgi:hypothetical protein
MEEMTQAPAGSDAFVARLNGADGTIKWLTTFGSSDGATMAHDVAVTGAGDVVVVGVNSGVINLGGAYIHHGNGIKPNAFVLQLDGETGAGKWGVGLGDDNFQWSYSVAASGDNMVYVAGDFLGKIVLDQTYDNPGLTPHMFVAKYDLALPQKLQWANVYAVNAFHQGFDPKKAGMGVGARTGDGALIAGRFTGATDFGSGPIPSAGGTDGFALRLEEDGATRWVTTASGPNLQAASCAALGPGGEAYIGGHFGTAFQLGGFMLQPNMGWAGFLARLSP